MSEFLRLVYNETEKLYKRQRITVIFLILLILIPIFVYAQYQQYEERLERLGTDDWRISLQQRITDNQNRLNSFGLAEEWRAWLRVRVEQQQFYLDHDINPDAPGAPNFTRSFLEQSGSLFIPLLVMVGVIDIVSGERSEGTIKVLLTRPVKRWKILLSKYVTSLLLTSFIVLAAAVMSYLISGLVFGYSGFQAPVLSGFSILDGTLDTTNVHLVPQWKHLLMTAGLVWFVAIVVMTISFMVSVLIRNTAAGMGVMLAALISGEILRELATAWEGAKYIFSVNTTLTDYLSGQLPSIDGMTMEFSLMNLTVWGVGALIVSFLVFIKQDMVN